MPVPVAVQFAVHGRGTGLQTAEPVGRLEIWGYAWRYRWYTVYLQHSYKMILGVILAIEETPHFGVFLVPTSWDSRNG